MYVERREVEDRNVIVPFRGVGPHELKPQFWPRLTGMDFIRNKEIDEQLGVGKYWSPPPSPSSSGTRPWLEFWEDESSFNLM